MKYKIDIKKGILIILIIVSLLLTVTFFLGFATYRSQIKQTNKQILLNTQVNIPKINITDSKVVDLKPQNNQYVEKDGAIYLTKNQEISFNFNVADKGEYYVFYEYKILGNKLNNSLLELNENNKNTYIVYVNNYVVDSTKKFDVDRYGNEIPPEQKTINQFVTDFMKDNKRINALPITLKLEKGSHQIVLKNIGEDILLKQLKLVKKEKKIDYKEYIKTISNIPDKQKTLEIIEAESYVAKSDWIINLGNEQSISVNPYNIKTKKINIIDGQTFKTPGQTIIWEFNVPQDGYYNIAFRYMQNINKGMAVFRNIKIDGEVPFAELDNYPFKYTGYKWTDKIISDPKNNPYMIYLNKGTHYISLEVDAAKITGLINQLLDITHKIQALGMDIKKLVGNNQDPNRTWDIKEYMPNIVSDLNKWADLLDNQYRFLRTMTDSAKSPFLLDLKISSDQLRRIATEPEKIPYKLDELSEGSSSVAQRLGDLINKLKEQPMSIDRIYVFKNTKLPKQKSTFALSVYEEIARLYYSLINKNDSYGIYSNDKQDNQLKIWVNRPIQYVETLQYLIDTDFTKKTGIKARLSVMPNEQKLILANAAQKSPDIALGISNWIPFELALRGIAYDLREYKDFLSYIKKDYNLETLVPFLIGDKIYGVTETQDFYVLFYRKDILDKLNIPVPNTWEDVKEILPELQRYGMNFYLPLCSSATKYFYTTAPYIFQTGGQLYTKDGLKTAINTQNSVKGFELMTELFTIYGIPEQVANFYNDFRYGKIPIGVSNFATYITLMNAASELSGLWDIAPSPGVKNSNGQIVRYQVASDRSDVVFNTSNKKKEAWEFLKWWLSKDTQVKYANMLITRYGPLYLWNTANLNAFKELYLIDNKHKNVILEQWKWTKEIPRHPGGYMSEREISNIWNNVVINGDNLRTAIDKSSIIINRELERKLTEFGYIKNGKVIKPYTIYSIDELKNWGE
ncbi:extracellular solute-binding protein [Caldicellulosiruptoraceae bacterium PP1]